ncbi:MAG: VanZ family protein [Magnetococcales bacterium]|nr:VanZ family protein [Magnetococcales bacterium]
MVISSKISWQNFWLIALLSYSAFIFYLSGKNDIKLPVYDIPFQDKVFHGVAYALMAYIASRFFSSLSKTDWPLFWSWVYCLVYGASDEWHQSFVPGRYADIFDWYADAAGAAVVLLVIFIYRSLQQTNTLR